MDQLSSELVKLLPIGIITHRVTDPDHFENTIVEKANEAAYSILKGVLPYIIGKTLKESPQIPSAILAGAEQAYRTNMPVLMDDIQLTSFGLTGWFHVRFFRLAETEYVIGTIERQDRTNQLEYSNQALQSFVYAASHDLREPLSKITAFGTRLKDTQKNLDTKGNEYLEVMLRATDRLTQLIDDLLSFSRMGEKEQTPPVWVNTDEILKDVLSDLSVSLETSHAEVHIQPDLPDILAHPMRVRQIFQNLISNGLKFHKPNQKPIINIGGKIEHEQTIFTVADNGIGFDPDYKEKIFNVFTRLHSRFEYPGTGLGLALCRRIVSLYGGTITADGRSNEGAIFTIIFPYSSKQ